MLNIKNIKMAKITEISPQERAPHRVNVYVEGVFKFGIDERLLLDFNLYVGKEITEAEIEKYKEGDNYQKCMDKAFRFLSFRMRSEKEMRDKLAEKFDEATVKKAIKRLKELKFIDDVVFAKSWVESRRIGRGKKALAFELGRKGIAKNIIDDAIADLSQDDEFELALELVKKKSKYKNLDRNEAYQKVGGFLSRRGYSYDVIKKVIQEITKPK